MTNVSNVNFDIEVVPYFNEEAQLVIAVYQQGFEEPLFETTIELHKVVREFLEVTSGPDGLIQTIEDEEMAEELVDEFQYMIDDINNHLRDYDGI